LRIKGESLGNVHFAIDYLKNSNSYDLGEEVAVIGAGNSAIDAARTAIRKGCRQVTIYSRRKNSTANQREIEYALIDGVKFKSGLLPIELTDSGPIMAAVEFDPEGHIKTVAGSEQLYKSDSIIIAVGQGPKNIIVNSTAGININNIGLVVTDECGSTSREGVFASGDVVNGPRTVVEAVKKSKMVADTMDKYMNKIFVPLQCNQTLN
jgi:glutamate synthase (NADPH/NADH) small chain